MLSFFKTKKLSSMRPAYWDAPDHFITPRGPRSNIDLEREAAEQRLRAMRNVGMW